MSDVPLPTAPGHLRSVLTELAWSEQKPELDHLLRPEDVPRLPHRLPRPLTSQQDQQLQQELLRRNDRGANAFLLIRHTGMRIGECADLRCDCLHAIGPDQWTIHIPLGKLKPNECFRWTHSSVNLYIVGASFDHSIHFRTPRSSIPLAMRDALPI